METRYSVRQTVEMTGIKSYVLRYWEEELNSRSREMSWDIVITPDMIFSFS